jgi:hypothetical protein
MDLNTLNALIVRYGLQRFASEILPLARPALRLEFVRCPEEEIPVGASKAGGSFDLPPDPDAEEELTHFLIQINYAELSEKFPALDLPREGLLVMFQEDDGGMETNALFIGPENQQLLRRTGRGAMHPACAITFTEIISLPRLGTGLAPPSLQEIANEISDSDNDYSPVEDYTRLVNHASLGLDLDAPCPHDPITITQIGGYPAHIQNCAMEEWAWAVFAEGAHETDAPFEDQYEAFLASPARRVLLERFRLVLQLDSEPIPDFGFVDAGRHYVMAGSAALFEPEVEIRLACQFY